MKRTHSPFARAIMLWTLISAALTALFALWQHLAPTEWVLSAAITAGTVCYHFLMRLLVGAAVPALFRNRLRTDHGWFRQRAFERKLYRALNVRHWKGKMPTYDPREFSIGENSLEQIIRNSCSAELVHEFIMVFSFLPLAVIPLWGAAGVFVITSVLSALGDSMFVIMQRYNRPRLEHLANRKNGSSRNKV